MNLIADARRLRRDQTDEETAFGNESRFLSSSYSP